MAKHCNSTSGPDFTDGKQPVRSTDTPKSSCDSSTGKTCPSRPKDAPCTPFQLSKSNDTCLMDGLANEALVIGGADIHVHKLLGVHEQTLLTDVIGHGTPISGGNIPGYNASFAFDKFETEWRSVQTGDGVKPSAFIGYDFGEIKSVDGSRRKYGVDTSIFKHITAFAIKQSENKLNRATKVRLERSPDGKKWYGVQIVPLPDDDCLNTVLVKDSVRSKFWRIRPVDFNGGSNDYWGVQALSMVENYVATHEDNIQDKIFLENRDRDYMVEPLLLKGSYDLLDVTTDLTPFGIELPSESMYLTVNFSATVATLGRPIIIGDIIELPSEQQYSAEMRPIKKYLEVTDVGWSTEGYTPGWTPTMLRIILQPAFASQETQDIFGDLAEQDLPEAFGLQSNGDGHNKMFQDYSDVSQEIMAQSDERVPERGREVSDSVRNFEDIEVERAKKAGVPNLNKLGQNQQGLYAEDAMPPNQAPYTEGDVYPEKPKNKAYHRLTYTGLSEDVPARLYRFSTAKNRWIYLETDRRAEYNNQKPKLQEFLKNE